MKNKQVKQISIKLFEEDEKALEDVKSKEGLDNSNAIRFALIFTSQYYDAFKKNNEKLNLFDDILNENLETSKNTNWRVNQLYLKLDELLKLQKGE